MLKTILKTMSAAVVAASVMVPGASFAKNTKDVIKMPSNNWESQVVMARVIGTLLKKHGWKVEYVPMGTQVQFPAMGNGDVHLQVEVWKASMDKAFMKEVNAGKMISIVEYSAKTAEDWWYPSYVEEVCPGMPDWKAFNKCAKKFATAETGSKGRYLAGPADWGKRDQERIDALDLNFEVVNAGSSAALAAELKSAAKRKQPIVLFNWTPNWIQAAFPGKFVKWPEYDPKCYTDASWGINPDMTDDCGNDTQGYLKMGAWSGFPKKWPEAYKILKKVDLTSAQIAAMANYNAKASGNLPPQEAADAWIKNNKSVWKKWFK